jgi:hypothetical protein
MTFPHISDEETEFLEIASCGIGAPKILFRGQSM